MPKVAARNALGCSLGEGSLRNNADKISAAIDDGTTTHSAGNGRVDLNSLDLSGIIHGSGFDDAACYKKGGLALRDGGEAQSGNVFPRSEWIVANRYSAWGDGRIWGYREKRKVDALRCKRVANTIHDRLSVWEGWADKDVSIEIVGGG